MQRDWPKIIIIILVGIIIVVSIILTILYLKTDLLKSKEVLFKKYISQNVGNVAEILDFETEDNYIKILQNNDYSESANIELKYLESENDKEEVYNIQEKGIINNSDKASYRKISATYEKNDILAIETLKQDNMYGFRLADLVKQFVSVENSNLSYFVSSMGYDGKYFSDKLNQIDISELLEFSNAEIETLKKNYMNAIFLDIDKSSYSSKRNVMITLANNQSVTTTSYTLIINKNELDKIYKRVISQAINDQIILTKIEKIDQKITDAGFVEPEGESLKERYISKLQEISDNIEYEGEDKREITIKVFESKGQTLRTYISTETNEIIIDTDNLADGKGITLKTVEFTEEGENTDTYSLSKEFEDETIKRKLSYNQNSVKNFEIKVDSVNQEDGLDFIAQMNYSDEEISKLNVGANISITVGNTKTIPRNIYNDNNNIVLNDYDGDKIINILNSLKNKQIDSLEKKQISLKTKMLNNILIWIDEKEQEAAKEQQNNTEKQIQRFNNKFELYAGENLSYEHIQRLLKVVGNDMSNYKVLKGNKIQILIEGGQENQQKVEEIANAITDKNTYNVEMSYSDDGYVDAIIISVYEK